MTKIYSLIKIFGLFIICVAVLAKGVIDYFSKDWRMIVLGYFLGFLVAYTIYFLPEFLSIFSDNTDLSPRKKTELIFGAFFGAPFYPVHIIFLGMLNSDFTPLLLIAIWYPLQKLSKIESDISKLTLSTALTGAAHYLVFLVASTYRANVM